MTGKQAFGGCCFILLVLTCFLRFCLRAEAADQEEGQEGTAFLEEIDFSELNEMLKEQEFTKEIDFKELTGKLINGEEIDKKWLFGEIRAVLLQELNASRGYLIQMLLLAVAFSLLYHFSNVFENAAVTEISFYVVYMILLALVMKSFSVMSGIVSGTLESMMHFMRALLPAFCLSVMFSAGTLTSAGYYQLTLLLIYVIEAVLFYILLPSIHIYIILELLNHLTREELISKMTELVENGIKWVLKVLFTIVLGVNAVQSLLNPVIDGFKTSTFARTAGMIPGIGNSIQGVTEVMIGSGIIIKNGIGIAGMIFLLFLCAGPLIKVGILTLLYKLTGAVVQPIADKRLAGCMEGMGKGAGLFGKVLVTACAMLMLSIAMVSAATTWNR